MSIIARPVQIVHLYPKEMNIYGDTGNRIVLEKRLEWRGIPYETTLVSIGDNLPKQVDIIIGGGGQDASQGVVAKDLQNKKLALEELSNRGCVMLMVCGMYQLFGRRFLTSDNRDIKGIELLPVETIAEPGRLIGNIHVDVEEIGTVVGYENHSGRTYLDALAEPMGSVINGGGNDGKSGFEGCRRANIFGTYMHGPLLSKNPKFADLLLALAIDGIGKKVVLSKLDDELILKAHATALKRPIS